MHQTFDEPKKHPLTIREQRIEIEKRLDKLEKDFKKKEKSLRDMLRQLGKGCPHPESKVSYHGDPAGGNDSFHHCSDCGACY